jgi:hypothetical protein
MWIRIRTPLISPLTKSIPYKRRTLYRQNTFVYMQHIVLHYQSPHLVNGLLWPIRRTAYARQTSFQNMGIHHGRLHVAMAEMLLERADIIVPSSGWVTGKWQLRVNSDGRHHAESWSDAGGIAAVVGLGPAGKGLARSFHLTNTLSH